MIVLTQGDQIDLQMTCDGFDLTDAVMTTIFKSRDGRDLKIPSDQHTIPDQSEGLGKFTLALTAADTAEMMNGENLSIITKIAQDGDIIHFHGEKVLTVKRSTFREQK